MNSGIDEKIKSSWGVVVVHSIWHIRYRYTIGGTGTKSFSDRVPLAVDAPRFASKKKKTRNTRECCESAAVRLIDHPQVDTMSYPAEVQKALADLQGGDGFVKVIIAEGDASATPKKGQTVRLELPGRNDCCR